ncbi:hypothetical protein GQR58_028595 [Nymphon striatum]|nr:hypothetical protein GQR58_028595 [Nymphon striatum]
MAILNRCCWFHNLDDGSIAVALFYMGVDIVGIAFFGVVLGLTEEVVEAFTAQGYEALQAEGRVHNTNEEKCHHLAEYSACASWAYNFDVQWIEPEKEMATPAMDNHGHSKVMLFSSSSRD